MAASLSLVTGANGHLGNNLVRHLLSQGLPVRASVRNPANQAPFAGLNCEVVPADLGDKPSLVKALAGVETLYAVAASFKLWAKDPEKEIYQVNLEGTRNLLAAAAEQGVKKVVYVSSIAALNYATSPMRESGGYNPDRRNVYYKSKNDSEKLAHELAKQLGLDLVSVLPSAMIGSEAFTLNESYNILRLIYQGKVPVETGIHLNWIDVKDVAAGCYAAATQGRPGERYILANEKSLSIRETIELVQRLHPERKLKLPLSVPKWALQGIASLMEGASKLTGQPPLLQRNLVDMLAGVRQDFDISKARQELGFAPKPAPQAVQEALEYLRQNERLLQD